jgi:hypothetical protein
MELLICGGPHRVAHDLESLFYVLLFICTHFGGPHNTVGNPPLYASGGVTVCDHSSGMKEWFLESSLHRLGASKFFHMVGFFESNILRFISPYFKSLEPHLSLLWETILPQRFTTPSIGKKSVHSNVTCSEIIEVFKTILLDKSLIAQAKQEATILGKRSLPGDLNVSSDGWDVVRPHKKTLSKEPKVKTLRRRQSKLMMKGSKSN